MVEARGHISSPGRANAQELLAADYGVKFASRVVGCWASEARRRRFVHHLALVRACSTTWVVSVYRHVVAERGARSS